MPAKTLAADKAINGVLMLSANCVCPDENVHAMQQMGGMQDMTVQSHRQTRDVCKKAYRPIGRQVWPSDGRVHEHNELVAAHV